jgi:predicted nuclease of predicted toxin-antitoxin system
MIKFVIDEDMPRSTARALAERGFECLDIRDYGLRGKSDKEIFEFAQREKAILLTGDMGFGNILFFPPGSHYGIFIAHFPNEISTKELNKQILEALDELSEDDLRGNLVILEPGKIRIRRG